MGASYPAFFEREDGPNPGFNYGGGNLPAFVPLAGARLLRKARTPRVALEGRFEPGTGDALG